MVESREREWVDWDYFWKRVEKHPKFLAFLYFIHLKKYFKILAPMDFEDIDILELGAGTGTAACELVKKYGGRATLVDDNPRAYALYDRLIEEKKHLTYLREDFFKLDLTQKYDLVFSDGVLEHFTDKGAIVELHKKYLKPDGALLIFALQKNLFSSFLELGDKKTGFSQPITLDECLALCESKGLKPLGTVSYFFEYAVLCKLKGDDT